MGSGARVGVDTATQAPSKDRLDKHRSIDKELGDRAFPSRSATAAGQRLSCDIRLIARLWGTGGHDGADRSPQQRGKPVKDRGEAEFETVQWC